MNSAFPSDDDFREFLQIALKLSSKSIHESIIEYREIKKMYYYPDQFILQCSQYKYNRVFVFLSLFIKKYNYEFFRKTKLKNSQSIIKYFGLIDDRFIDICSQHMKNHVIMKERFYPMMLKSFIFLQKTNIKDYMHEDLLKLNDNNFTTDIPRRRQFIFFLSDLLTQYNRKGSKVNFTKELRKGNINLRNFGIDNNDIVSTIKEYIDINYTLLGWSDKKPRCTIKLFFDWLSENNHEINQLSDISEENIQSYKKFVKENIEFSDYTKQNRINNVLSFFEWLFLEKKIEKKVVNICEREKFYSIDNYDESRMFIERKHYMMVVEKIKNYIPENEEEELCKYFCLVISATGFRLSECRWLKKGCILEKNEDVGVITLQTLDKTNIMNKKTSIYSWGMEAIEWLEQRFDSREKIKIYNKKLNEYVYTIFEYNGKILSKAKLLDFLKTKIFDSLDFYDKNGRKINYDGKKFHALRHQKFNDIFEVTGGSSKAAQIDSGHKDYRMLKIYTRQKREEKIAEVSRYIEEGKIVGKGAELLQQLLQTNMLPEEYLDIAKKMNISAFYTLDHLKTSLKFLGFGYCRSSNCKFSKLCEGCNYFLTNEKYINHLKRRYSVNYILTMCKVKDLSSIDKSSHDSIISLKYQEKWLSELGLTESEIKELRTNIIGQVGV